MVKKILIALIVVIAIGLIAAGLYFFIIMQ